MRYFKRILVFLVWVVVLVVGSLSLYALYSKHLKSPWLEIHTAGVSGAKFSESVLDVNMCSDSTQYSIENPVIGKLYNVCKGAIRVRVGDGDEVFGEFNFFNTEGYSIRAYLRVVDGEIVSENEYVFSFF